MNLGFQLPSSRENAVSTTGSIGSRPKGLASPTRKLKNRTSPLTGVKPGGRRSAGRFGQLCAGWRAGATA